MISDLIILLFNTVIAFNVINYLSFLIGKNNKKIRVFIVFVLGIILLLGHIHLFKI